MGNYETWRNSTVVTVTSALLTGIITVLGLYNSQLSSPTNISVGSLSANTREDVTGSDDWISVVKARQEQRKALLTDMCNKYFPLELNNTEPPRYFYPPNLISSDRQRFLYCIIPKSACTSWKRRLSRANGAPGSLDVHTGHIWRYVDNFHALSREKKRRVLTNYFKFVFVRHPFERLISAHQDKFVEWNRIAFPGVNRFIRRKFRNGTALRGSRPTFRELVRYIIDPGARRPFNQHWKEFHELCHPCRVRYDFIGHYETLADDTRYVLRRLGIRADQLPKSSRYHNTSRRVADLLTQLTRDEIRRLTDVYRWDFILFGYSPDPSQFAGN